MRVIRPPAHDEAKGLAATVFFWPANEPVFTRATSGEPQDVSDYLGELFETEACLAPPPKYSIDATELATCVYEKVGSKEFPPFEGLKMPRGVAVVPTHGGPKLFSPNAHMFHYKFVYHLPPPGGEGDGVFWLYTVWCLY